MYMLNKINKIEKNTSNILVSLRCKMIVKDALKKMGIEYVVLDLGMVEILTGGITAAQREQLKADSASIRVRGNGR